MEQKGSLDELGVQPVGLLQEALPDLEVDRGWDRTREKGLLLQSVCHPYIHLATRLCGII